MKPPRFILLALRLHFPGGDAFKIDAIRGNCEVAPIGTKKILRQNPPRGRRRGEQLCSRNHSGGASSLFSEAVSHFASLKDLALTSAGVEIFNDSGVGGSAFSAGKGTEVDALAGVPRRRWLTSQVGQ